MANRKVTTLIVVHVTATPPSRDIGVAEVRAMHKAQGWSDIGYGGLLRRDGRREIGRGLDAVGAHVAGFNSISLGIALVGGINAAGKPEHNATEPQLVALEAWLQELVVQYPQAKICGHRDLSPDRDGDGVIEPGEWMKACPCFDVIPWAVSKGLPGADIKGNWGEIIAIPADTGGTVKVAGPDARLVYLQKLLARTGLQFGPIDGIVGERTASALRLYQEFNGLPQSGAFDEATVKLLRGTFEAKAAA
ncbi:peptidoglycan-binding domain-containing protein [uncultured Devosia sp.]|uniref:peptidoglycan-binding domain-containing protein n=1 Tax=uncultured Devosia sp. TaxID=211434 RepID=UPI002636B62C|nr:peptidoglycan-binding domain-containing protein [uncultured Devosia sp.]